MMGHSSFITTMVYLHVRRQHFDRSPSPLDWLPVRQCPQCSGARRADWLDKSAAVILPNVPYFQVVFTLPSELSSLILGNRQALYHLLFQSAWKALDGELRRTGKFHPAALMVLHT